MTVLLSVEQITKTYPGVKALQEVSFSVEAAATTIRVDVAVPDGADECLDEFERMATSALATRSERD